MVAKYWIGGEEFTPEEFDNVIKLYPEDQTRIFFTGQQR